MWTIFIDMHSGGAAKAEQEHIYIEAPEGEASEIFSSRFGRSAYGVSCPCCGSDYFVYEADSLGQATGNIRGCARENGMYVEQPAKADERHVPVRYQSLDEYLKRPDVLVIRADEFPADSLPSVPRSADTLV